MSLSNLFVTKLPRSINDSGLLSIFTGFKAISAKVMLDPCSGSSKGFGFVLFDTEEDGLAAYQSLNNSSARVGRHVFTLVIYPSQHNGKAAASPSRAVYIRNIPRSIEEHEVEKFLSQYGRLEYWAMRGDHHGSPVWVVYAEYDSLESSRRVLERLHGNSDYFHGPPIMVKYADSEEAKRERRRRWGEGRSSQPLNRICSFLPHGRKYSSMNYQQNELTETSQSLTQKNSESSNSSIVYQCLESSNSACTVECQPQLPSELYSQPELPLPRPALPRSSEVAVDLPYVGIDALTHFPVSDTADNEKGVFLNGQRVVLSSNAVNFPLGDSSTSTIAAVKPTVQVPVTCTAVPHCITSQQQQQHRQVAC
ncbi:unnamed protein product [Trypanosoma congolense IL3000]|uniref:WGS project CAEQ00000000 data, annotated contig 2242 n=1 Tax=Trypanosoma congolense (strain IL3000) TaxID=1068625 RepID=F9WCK3_TRYCI|nr:unnamed protein product [Trypanosoma congolense IL3000]